jgi:hypothetical protein
MHRQPNAWILRPNTITQPIEIVIVPSLFGRRIFCMICNLECVNLSLEKEVRCLANVLQHFNTNILGVVSRKRSEQNLLLYTRYVYCYDLVV